MTDPCKWSFAKDGTHREFVLPGPFTKAEGKKICQDCCRFLGWHNLRDSHITTSAEADFPTRAPQVGTTEDERERAYLLLKGDVKLPDWEFKFMSDIQKKGAWTEKQRAVFERIANKYLKTNQETKPIGQPKPTSSADDDFFVPF